MRDYYDIIGPLQFPIRGKLYSCPPMDAALGVELKLAAEGNPTAKFKRMTNLSVVQLVLGSAYDEMVADSVDQGAIDQAFLAAMAEFRGGRDEAERVWEAAADPKFRASLRAAAEAAAKATTRTTSTSTGSAKRTPSRASTPRIATARAGLSKPKAGASRGGRSSTNGDS